MNKSKTAGFPGHSSNGVDLATYIALENLICSNCLKEIKINDIFSRSNDKLGKTDGIRYVLCRTCKPFTEKKLNQENYFI